MHRQFKLLFGLAVDEAFEHIAYYKLTRIMHKDPNGARFISSSESSSMQPIPQGLSGLFKVVQSEVATLFGNALQSMSISENGPPLLLAKDCERLYTNIPLHDMKAKVMGLITRVFNLPEHARLGHVAVKVRETKHAQCLKAHQVSVDYHARTGTGDGGDFVIFDLRMIEIWVVFLLDNLFVSFGDQFTRQAIGAPMGSSCSGGNVNLYRCS